METVALNRFESQMWVNRMVLNSLQYNRIIDYGKLLGGGFQKFKSPLPSKKLVNDRNFADIFANITK